MDFAAGVYLAEAQNPIHTVYVLHCCTLKHSVGARNGVGIGLPTCRTAGLHRLAESIRWNRLLGSLKV